MVTSLLGFVFALAESGLGLGAVLPGEVAISGLAANVDGALPLLALGIAVALGASAGTTSAMSSDGSAVPACGAHG